MALTYGRDLQCRKSLRVPSSAWTFGGWNRATLGVRSGNGKTVAAYASPPVEATRVALNT
jgi:hypothetical protein